MTKNTTNFLLKNKVFLVILVMVMLVNLLLFTFVVDPGVTYDNHGNKIVLNKLRNFELSLLFMFIIFPIVSVPITFMVAIIPYREIKFRSKFVRVFILTLLLLNLLFPIIYFDFPF
jgi:hypothetical protein